MDYCRAVGPRGLCRPVHEQDDFPRPFFAGSLSRTGREGRGSLKSVSLGHAQPAPVRAGRGCYRPHDCGEAGKRIGSLCAIEVEGPKRRPAT